MGVHVLSRETHPLQQLHLKKGGGPIFGDYGKVAATLSNPGLASIHISARKTRQAACMPETTECLRTYVKLVTL